MKKILFIVGSTRVGSFNHQLAEEAHQLLNGRASVSYLGFDDIPFINQDREFPTPAAVKRARDAVAATDAVWLFSPEYNTMMPAVVKNLFDWLSRPVAPGSTAPTPLAGKPIVFAGAGGRNKAAGSLAQARELCTFLRMNIVDTPAVTVAVASGWGTGLLALTPEEQAALATCANNLLAALDALDAAEKPAE